MTQLLQRSRLNSQMTTTTGKDFEGILCHSNSHQLRKADMPKFMVSGLEVDVGGTACVTFMLPNLRWLQHTELLAFGSFEVIRKN